MTGIACRANFFDASALARYYCDEPCSEVLRPYFNSCATKYTTPFCFYEAMNVLKGKWKYRNELNREQYLLAASHLTAWYGASSGNIKDLDFTDPLVFKSARDLVKRTELDLSDAFQILSVKYGYFSSLVRESQTILVTADKPLAKAAREEGLRVWSIMEEAAP
jgi:predicted nucleic acid-binding protein